MILLPLCYLSIKASGSHYDGVGPAIWGPPNPSARQTPQTSCTSSHIKTILLVTYRHRMWDTQLQQETVFKIIYFHGTLHLLPPFASQKPYVC